MQVSINPIPKMVVNLSSNHLVVVVNDLTISIIYRLVGIHQDKVEVVVVIVSVVIVDLTDPTVDSVLFHALVQVVEVLNWDHKDHDVPYVKVDPFSSKMY